MDIPTELTRSGIHAAGGRIATLEPGLLRLPDRAIPIDLNSAAVPRRLRGFDLVVNRHATEHARNQINAFRVVHDLAARNGIMYHEVASDGLATAGLISYQLRFFMDLARANEYVVLFVKADAATRTIHAAFRRQPQYVYAPPLDLPEHMPPPPPRTVFACGLRAAISRARARLTNQ